MKKGSQHIIPQCYSSAWIDPQSASSKDPYIWLLSKDGKNKKRRAPKNSLKETDAYTIKFSGKERDLTVEDTLATIENKFARLRKNRIDCLSTLSHQETRDLHIFASAMHNRVTLATSNFESFAEKLQNITEMIEKQHEVPPIKSKQFRNLVKNSRPAWVILNLRRLAEFYSQMSLAFLVAPIGSDFITSDAPSVWYCPGLHRFPPAYRSVGLGHPKIEVTMPLTPRIMLFISHNRRFTDYIKINSDLVCELNRRTLFYADQVIIAASDFFDPRWLIQEISSDRWEDSEEGKKDLAEYTAWQNKLKDQT